MYNTLVLPQSLYVCDMWTMKSKDISRITASEIKFMRLAEKIFFWKN